jgi:hypothetical protein
MKISDIITQLLRVLPFKTNYFSDEVSVTLSFSGGTVTATSPTAHGLSTGDFTSISGALFPTQITSITRVGNTATVTTTTDHDLTEQYHTAVEIVGADQSEYNGTKTLLRVLNRRTFTYTVTGDPATPATGTMFLNEDRLGYNGYFQITKVSNAVFTYTIAQTPFGSSSGVSRSKNRISGGITYERLVDAYTAKESEELWCFVVPQPTSIGRDLSVRGDPIAQITPGTAIRVTEIEAFSIYIFIPSKDISGISAYDLSDEVVPMIYSALLGYMPPSGLGEERTAGVTITGHGFREYSTAFYSHFMDFQLVRTIRNNDTFINDTSVAFRDIQLTELNDFDEALTVAQVDLDEEPL